MVPAVANGTSNSTRIGNKITWKSYHVRMVLKGGLNMNAAATMRIIWYLPRVSTQLMPTTTSVTDFVDSDAFIVYSDKIHRIGTNGIRAAGSDPQVGPQCFKLVHAGRVFKKGADLYFDNNLSSSLLTNHMRCYVVSDNPSASLSYTTSLDFTSTCYFTDA